MLKFEIKWLLSKPLYLNVQLYYLLIASNKNTYYRMFQVADISISRGSVATHLGCVVIFKYDYVANLLMSLIVKEFWKSVNIRRSYMQEYSVLFFIDSRCRLLSLIACWWCLWMLFGVFAEFTGVKETSWRHSLQARLLPRSAAGLFHCCF